MKQARFFCGWIAAAGIYALSAGSAFAAPLDDLIAAAKKEGTLDLLASSTMTPKGATAVADAFNKKYGLNIKVNYHPSSNYTKDTAKAIGMSASGVKPEWDSLLLTDSHHGSLWLRKLQVPFDFKSVGIDPRAIHYDSGAISMAHQIILPAYNKKILPAKDAPRKWEDILDPKWKGKIGVIHSVHHWARLAVGPWGEEKTTHFVRKLAQQEPMLGGPSEMYTRLQLGEVLIVSNMQNSFIYEAEKKGAPLAQAEGIEPVPAPAYHIGVLKGAAHPSAGHLLMVFLTTPEGQRVFEQYMGHSSAFVTGTDTHKFAQKYQMIFMNQTQAEAIDRLTREYGKIMGFSR